MKIILTKIYSVEFLKPSGLELHFNAMTLFQVLECNERENPNAMTELKFFFDLLEATIFILVFFKNHDR